MLERRNSETPLSEKYNVAKIMQIEKDAWKIKDIPRPPDELFQALERANEQGYTTLKPIFFPEKILEQDLSIASNNVGYWDCIEKGYLPTDARKLYELWTLIDTLKLTTYTRINPRSNEKDRLEGIIEELKTEGKVKRCRRIWSSDEEFKPRFAISWNQIHDVILPSITRIIAVPKESCRLLRYIERQELKKTHQQVLKNDNSIMEWLEDKAILPYKLDKKYDIKSARDLIENTKNHKPLYIDEKDFVHAVFNNDERNGNLCFRPIITFPIQK